MLITGERLGELSRLPPQGFDAATGSVFVPESRSGRRATCHRRPAAGCCSSASPRTRRARPPYSAATANPGSGDLPSCAEGRSKFGRADNISGVRLRRRRIRSMVPDPAITIVLASLASKNCKKLTLLMYLLPHPRYHLHCARLCRPVHFAECVA